MTEQEEYVIRSFIEREWDEMKRQEAQGWREGVITHDHSWRVLTELFERLGEVGA